MTIQLKGSSGGEDEDRTAPGVQPGAAAAVGCRAKLAGVSLWDLVQMECLSGRERVIRVSSGADVGYLFFRGGQIVHAVSRRGHCK